MLALVFLLIVSYAAAALNSWLVRHSARWYATLQKPPGASASQFLGPVWSAAYFLAAVAAWRIWTGRNGWDGAHLAFTAFFAELALSVIWPGLLFAARSVATGFIAALALWLAAVASDFAFWKISKFSGALMLGYVLWITYVVFWNARLLRLNRAD